MEGQRCASQRVAAILAMREYWSRAERPEMASQRRDFKPLTNKEIAEKAKVSERKIAARFNSRVTYCPPMGSVVSSYGIHLIFQPDRG